VIWPFCLTNTSGDWASAVNVLTPNADGNILAAHVFVTTSPANASNTALATGYATNGTAAYLNHPAWLHS
jgi:hypothetical protein